MRRGLIAVLLISSCSILIAQNPALSSADILRMTQAGLSDDLIVATINSKAGKYDTSADGIIALKNAGLSDRVVAAIVARAAGPAALASSDAKTATPATIPDSSDPAGQHDPGVYLLTVDHSGKQNMVFIDRAGSGNEKTSGILSHAFTYGIVKAKMKAELPGPRAVVRSSDEKPVFYMYFPPMTGQSGLGGTDSVTSPSQFSLLLLEKKKDHRETAIAKVGFANVSTGNDEKKQLLFTSERIRPYAYKLTPNADLKPGEYTFIASSRLAGTAQGASVVIYDFGVDLR
jgi:hypothetical protein